MSAFLTVFSFVVQVIREIFQRFLGKVGIGSISIENFMLAFASFSLFMRYVLGSLTSSMQFGSNVHSSRDQRRRTQK